MLLPAAALAAGALLAFHLTFLPAPLLVVLAALGFAWGRRSGTCVAWGALGLLVAALGCDLPDPPERTLDSERPVTLTARVAGPWTTGHDGWTAPIEVERLVQGDRIDISRLPAFLDLPGDEPPPPTGARLRAQGYLRRSPGYANREPVAQGPWRLRVKSRRLLAVEEGPGPLAWLSGLVRGPIETAVGAAEERASGLDRGQGTALARALVLGDASRLPVAWKRGLRSAGLAHLIAVSGLHVGMIAAGALLAGAFLPRHLRLAAAAAAIAAYLLAAGPLPSLLRAAVMGLLAVLALLLERPPAAANSLGWAVVLLVAGRPEVVRLASFRLTVAATAGILLLYPPLAERFARRLTRPLTRWLARSLALSVAAELTTLPISLPLFHTAAPLAPLANLVAVPWTALALLGCLLWTGAAFVSARLAAALLPGLDLLAAPFGWPAAPGAALFRGVPLLASYGAAALLAVGLLLLLLGGRRRLALAIPVLAVALAALAAPRLAEHGLELTLLDVGQGDAILLRDGQRAVLVDGGGKDGVDVGGRVLLPALLAEGVSRLDALVMTHPDRDHCGGLVDLAAFVPVDEIWTAPGWPATGCGWDFLTLPGPRLRVLWAGERAALGRWRLTVLNPAPGDRHGVNVRSLVLLAEASGRRALLTGDAEAPAERRMLAELGEVGLRADLLKVGHHGSKTSTTEDFLDAVAPRLALISDGVGNVYHHPSPVVLQRLEERGIPTLRTDRDGEIDVRIGEKGRLTIELPGAPR
jgi:competence protein ComEC